MSTVQGRHARSDENVSDERKSEQKTNLKNQKVQEKFSKNKQKKDAAAVDYAINQTSNVLEKKKHKKVLPIVILLAIMVALYSGISFYFTNHFYPNTEICKVDISNMTCDEAKGELDKGISAYNLKVEGEGISFELDSKDIGIAIDGDHILNEALAKNNSWAWPIEIFKKHEAEGSFAEVSNGNEISEIVNKEVEAFNEKAQASKDATVVYNKAVNTFVIQEEIYGTALDVDKVMKGVDEAISELKPKFEVTEEDLLDPVVLKDDERLKAAQDEANAILKTKIIFKAKDEEIASLGEEDLVPMVVLDKDLKVSLDEKSLDTFLSNLSGTLNTRGTKRTYERPDGKKVTVSGGTYGWLVDTEALNKEVKKDATAQKEVVVEVPYKQKAEVFNGAGKPDWGKRYIDVDISEQFARFYEDDSVIWKADIVSGTPDGEDDTPEGVYSLNGKQSPSILLGVPEPGSTEPSYKSKVEYWMPFVDNLVGFHDATWQSDFGGSRYKNGYGSHGCVNLSLEKAKSLYGKIKIGDVVVVHK